MLTFNQVMTEYAVFGKSVSYGSVKRSQIVDPLACKTRLAMEILIYVGDGSCVDVKTGIAR